MGRRVPKAKPAKKNARKPAAAASKPRRQRSDEELERERRNRRLAVHGLVLGAVAIGSTVGLDWIDARAAAQMSSEPPHVQFAWPPFATNTGGDPADTWLPEAQRQALIDLVHEHVSATESVPDASLRVAPLAAASERLFDSGWFEQPPTLQRTDGHTLAVHAAWRVPAAVVRAVGTDRVVDWQGRPMPFATPTDDRNDITFPLVIGIDRGPATGLDGKVRYAVDWPSDGVPAAMRLLRLLAEHDLLHQVDAIDAGSLARNGRLSIVTDRGSRIVWGVPPGDWSESELRTTSEKIEMLSSFRADTGRIDANEDRVLIYGQYPLADDSPGG